MMKRRDLFKLGGIFAAAAASKMPSLMAQSPALERSRVGCRIRQKRACESNHWLVIHR